MNQPDHIPKLIDKLKLFQAAVETGTLTEDICKELWQNLYDMFQNIDIFRRLSIRTINAHQNKHKTTPVIIGDETVQIDTDIVNIIRILNEYFKLNTISSCQDGYIMFEVTDDEESYDGFYWLFNMLRPWISQGLLSIKIIEHPIYTLKMTSLDTFNCGKELSVEQQKSLRENNIPLWAYDITFASSDVMQEVQSELLAQCQNKVVQPGDLIPNPRNFGE